MLQGPSDGKDADATSTLDSTGWEAAQPHWALWGAKGPKGGGGLSGSSWGTWGAWRAWGPWKARLALRTQSTRLSWRAVKPCYSGLPYSREPRGAREARFPFGSWNSRWSNGATRTGNTGDAWGAL